MRLLQYKSNEMFSSTELIRKSKMIFNKILDGSVEKAIILRDGKPSFLLMDFAKYEAVMSEFEELKEYVESIKSDSTQEEPKPKKKKKEKNKLNNKKNKSEPIEIEANETIVESFNSPKIEEPKKSKKNKKSKDKNTSSKLPEQIDVKEEEKRVEFSLEPKPKEEIINPNKFSKEDINHNTKPKIVTPPRPEPIIQEIPKIIEEEIISPLTEIVIDDEKIEEIVEPEKIEKEEVPIVEEISEEEEIQTALDSIKSIDFDDNMRKIAEDQIKEKILHARALREIKAEEERKLIEQEEEEEQEIVNQIEEQKEQKQRELSEFWD